MAQDPIWTEAYFRMVPRYTEYKSSKYFTMQCTTYVGLDRWSLKIQGLIVDATMIAADH